MFFIHSLCLFHTLENSTLHGYVCHYVSDALAAIGVGMELGVSPTSIRSALGQFRNMAGRQEIFEAKGITFIKDCYNAGPESMAAALAVLGGRSGRRVAVLGDMLELGFCAPAEHYRVGRIAAEKADAVLSYGPNSGRIVSGALTGGMPVPMAKAFTDRAELLAAMKRMIKSGDVVLIKGSHGMHMDQILDQYLKET
jgi:UDP-N-acetylmuramoyl-tripeptide--D-alanyl-D-alanine ligase